MNKHQLWWATTVVGIVCGVGGILGANQIIPINHGAAFVASGVLINGILSQTIATKRPTTEDLEEP